MTSWASGLRASTKNWSAGAPSIKEISVLRYSVLVDGSACHETPTTSRSRLRRLLPVRLEHRFAPLHSRSLLSPCSCRPVQRCSQLREGSAVKLSATGSAVSAPGSPGDLGKSVADCIESHVLQSLSWNAARSSQPTGGERC